MGLDGDDSLLTTQFDGYKWKFDKGRGLLRETIVEDYAVSYLKSINEWNEDAVARQHPLLNT